MTADHQSLNALLTAEVLPTDRPADEHGEAMENPGLVPAVGLMITGVALFMTALFRTLGHNWSHGWYEAWVLPLAGAALILLGLWIIR